jgi:hypothetical protein
MDFRPNTALSDVAMGYVVSETESSGAEPLRWYQISPPDNELPIIGGSKLNCTVLVNTTSAIIATDSEILKFPIGLLASVSRLGWSAYSLNLQGAFPESFALSNMNALPIVVFGEPLSIN